MMRVLLLAVCLVSLVLVPAASAASCGSTNGGFNTHITASGVSCKTARDVARAWLSSVMGGNRGTHRVADGFTCVNSAIPAGDASVRVRCTRGGAVIKWVAAP
jgi:hypothetical protein